MDVASGRKIRTIEYQHYGPVAWSPDGRFIACCSADKTIKIWDSAAGRQLRTLTGHTGWVNVLTWSPDGRALASGSDDKTVRIWDAASGRELRTIPGEGMVHALAWSPDGRAMATGSETVRIWDTTSWHELSTLIRRIGVDTLALAWSPDGRCLASGSNTKIIEIWDATSGRVLSAFAGSANFVRTLAFSPDGRSLASGGSDDGTIKIWSLAADDALCKYAPSRESIIRAQAEKIAADLLIKKQASSAEDQRLADEAAAKRLAQQIVEQKLDLHGKAEAVASIASSSASEISTNQPSASNSKDRPIRDKWAVVVGVSKFQDPTIPKLQYPAKDARDFYNFLITKANFRPDHVRLLLDEKATKKRINSEIGDKFLPFVVGPDDLVVVYFATHGSPAEKDVRGDSYLIAYDTEKTELWSDGIDMPKLLGTLQERTRADRILIVLDACHSGAADPNSRALDFQSTIDIEKLLSQR